MRRARSIPQETNFRTFSRLSRQYRSAYGSAFLAKRYQRSSQSSRTVNGRGLCQLTPLLSSVLSTMTTLRSSPVSMSRRLPFNGYGRSVACDRSRWLGDQVSRRTLIRDSSDGLSDPHPASKPGWGSAAIECFVGGRAGACRSSQRGSAPSPCFRDLRTTIVKERDRRAPRSSILAQLGGVALLAEGDPRHPVIGDSSGRSAGRAAVIIGGQLGSCLEGFRAPSSQPASRTAVSAHAAAAR